MTKEFAPKFIGSLFVFNLALSLGGCGNDASINPTPDPAKAAAAAGEIIADAGDDQNVQPGSLVTLDGSGSTVGGVIYHWSQLSGPTVTLSSLGDISPTFTAPA